MVAPSLKRRSFIDLYDLTPEIAEFLPACLGSMPPSDEREPLVVPAVARDVTWKAYKRFLTALKSRYLRHSYMGGALELMPPRLFERENTKAVLRRFVQTLRLETRQPIVTLGTITLASPDQQLGIETDEAFRFARRRPAFDPLFLNVDKVGAPDLVIEVGRLSYSDTIARVSAVYVDRLALLARVGAAELWSLDRDRVKILHHFKGQLRPASHSRFLSSVSGPILTRHLRNRFRIGENASILEFVREALNN